MGYSKKLKYKYLKLQEEKKKKAITIFEKVMIKSVTKLKKVIKPQILEHHEAQG